MPAPNSSLQYFGVDKTIIPYRSNTSVVDESPHWVIGSANAMASVSGWVEKRPGFANPVESTLSAIPGRIVDIFLWRRWSGNFYVMVCAVTDTTSTVWAYQQGTPSFVLIYTDTTSTQPFNFIVSNNLCFFGNGTTRANMRKFDGTLCTLWGLDAPAAPPEFTLTTGNLPPGMTFDLTTGTLSGTPTVAGSSTVTVTVTDAVSTTAQQTYTLQVDSAALEWRTPPGALQPATQGAAFVSSVVVSGGTAPYVYSVASGALPAGLTLSSTGGISGTPTTPGTGSFAVKVVDHAGAVVTRGFSIFVSDSVLTMTPTSLPNAQTSVAYTQTISTAGGTAPYTYAAVNGGLPAGLTLGSTGTLAGTPTGFGTFLVTVRANDAAGHSAEIRYTLIVDPVVLSVTSTKLPTAQVGVAYSAAIPVGGGVSPYTFTYAAGAITAQTGYAWGFTYTSRYGHESAMSALSAYSGLFTDQDAVVTVIASADAQVTGINLYRTTDGGSQDPSVMRLLASLPNTNQSYVDSTQDVFLGSKTGPGFYVNDPPQPMKGLVWSNGRIWGFKDAKTFFTGAEEITNGMAEECMSDAINGNFYAWPAEVGGLAVTPEGVNIGLPEQFWHVSGDTLDVFRKSILLSGGGTRAPRNLCAVGSTVYWLDTAKQVFSSAEGEIGEPVRPDLLSLDPAQTYLVHHKSKLYNWLCVLDALHGRLLVYDLDLKQWHTPWLVPGMTSLASGELTLGNIALVAGYAGGHVRVLTPGAYLDDGQTYGDELRSNLFSISPGSHTTARNREEVRQVVQFEMEVNMIAQDDGSYLSRDPDWFGTLVDDDPAQTDATLWVDLEKSVPMRYLDETVQKRYLAARRWMANNASMGSRVAFRAAWDASAQPWRVYTFDLAWRRT